jgi:preprotein translocase subunit SecY
MFNVLINKKKNKKKPTEKLLLTIFLLFLFRFLNTIPLAGIDQEALKKSFFQLENKASIMQIINMYSSGGNSLISPFSLGIIPFINASIIMDLLTALIPYLEKLQSEEGEAGRQTLLFYKKLLALLLATIQSIFLLFYLKPYFYSSEFFDLAQNAIELVTGSMIIVWISNLIDNKGIGNGTSFIILTNIVTTIVTKSNIIFEKFSLTFFLEGLFIVSLMALMCISQIAKINIDVVSARQLAFLQNLEKAKLATGIEKLPPIKGNGLSIKLTQAGIFPIIIASNLLPFLTFFVQNKIIEKLIYYFLIIGFNYFYTIVFWDPEKISEQLRKASVSLINVTPGKNTIVYLENVVRSSSIIGGIFLSSILILYDFVSQFTNAYLLKQLNVSSLIIVVGVAFEIQKTIRANYKNITE